MCASPVSVRPSGDRFSLPEPPGSNRSPDARSAKSERLRAPEGEFPFRKPFGLGLATVLGADPHPHCVPVHPVLLIGPAGVNGLRYQLRQRVRVQRGSTVVTPMERLRLVPSHRALVYTRRSALAGGFIAVLMIDCCDCSAM